MKTYRQLVEEAAESVEEIMPWDLEEMLADGEPPLLLDVREPGEYDAMHIEGALNVPRGVLEPACEYDYDETEPALVTGRDRKIVVICRSGHRSVLAARAMQQLGFSNVISLKTGMRGWNDYEQPMVDKDGKPVDIETADEFFETRLRPEQIDPARRERDL